MYVNIYRVNPCLPSAHQQALVCLSTLEILDVSRGRPFHCKMANTRFFLQLSWPTLFSHSAAFNDNGL